MHLTSELEAALERALSSLIVMLFESALLTLGRFNVKIAMDPDSCVSYRMSSSLPLFVLASHCLEGEHGGGWSSL